MLPSFTRRPCSVPGEWSWWRWVAVAAAFAALGAVTMRLITEGHARSGQPLLVEYLDPDCGHSRRAHGSLMQALEKRSDIRYQLVPIALTRGAKYVRADILCALDERGARALALEWAHNGLRADLEVPVDQARLAACPEKVMAYSEGAARLRDPPSPTSPVVTYRNRVYFGAKDIDALANELSRGVR